MYVCAGIYVASCYSLNECRNSVRVSRSRTPFRPHSFPALFLGKHKWNSVFSTEDNISASTRSISNRFLTNFKLTNSGKCLFSISQIFS